MGSPSTAGRIDAPVVVKPDTISNKALGFDESGAVEEFTVNGHADTVAEAYALKNALIFEKQAHSFVKNTIIPATCSANGLASFACVCGKSYTEMIPATKHDNETTVVPATCNTPEFTISVCKVCGQSNSSITAPIKEHVFEKQTVIDASCINVGLVSLTCKNCSYSKVEATTAKGHKLVTDTEEIKATCTESGMTAAVHCSVCGYKAEAQFVPATGRTGNLHRNRSHRGQALLSLRRNSR